MSNFSKSLLPVGTILRLGTILSCGAILSFNSCRSLPTSPETASIDGQVILAGPWFEEPKPPYSGVQVKIEGTNFTAVSDDSGYYSFTGVPTGTYNVSFTKAGYGEVRWMSVTVTGGGNAPLIWQSGPYEFAPNFNVPTTQILFQIPNLIATLGSVYFKDTTVVQYGPATALIARGTVTPDPSIPQSNDAMVLFVSHTSDVSDVPGHYNASYWRWEGMLSGTYPLYPVDTTTDNFTFAVPQGYLTNFKSGDSIYVAAYGTSAYYGNVGGDYFNPILQQVVFTAINGTPSPVMGTVVP